jgi:hypothetical protein
MVSPEPAGRTMVSNSLSIIDLAGSWACIETSRKGVEQERPVANPRERGACAREIIEARARECGTGVGLAHSVCWAAPRSGGLKSHWRPGKGRHIQKRG